MKKHIAIGSAVAALLAVAGPAAAQSTATPGTEPQQVRTVTPGFSDAYNRIPSSSSDQFGIVFGSPRFKSASDCMREMHMQLTPNSPNVPGMPNCND